MILYHFTYKNLPQYVSFPLANLYLCVTQLKQTTILCAVFSMCTSMCYKTTGHVPLFFVSTTFSVSLNNKAISHIFTYIVTLSSVPLFWVDPYFHLASLLLVRLPSMFLIVWVHWWLSLPALRVCKDMSLLCLQLWKIFALSIALKVDKICFLLQYH